MCFYELISAVLTAQNIPLINWSKTTLNNILLIQGDKMYLQALDIIYGFFVLEPGVEFLSVGNFNLKLSVFQVVRSEMYIFVRNPNEFDRIGFAHL